MFKKESTGNISLKNILFVILLALAWISAVFCYENPDYYSYRLIYEYYTPAGLSNSNLVDIGFVFLCNFFYKAGFSFEMFRGIYLSIAMFLMYESLRYFRKDNNFAILLYLIFPFALDVVQMRFMLSTAITIYALRFLKERNVRKYVVYVLIASTQQILSLFYLLLILTLVDKKLLIKIVSVLFIVEIVCFFFSNSIINNIINKYFRHYISYLDYTQYANNLAYLYIFMTMVIILYVYTLKDFPDADFSFIQKIVLLNLLFIPFIFINENFTRLFRGMIFFIYIGMEDSCKMFNLKKDRRIISFLFCAFMFYIHLSPHNDFHWNHVFLTLFKNNYFWELIKGEVV